MTERSVREWSWTSPCVNLIRRVYDREGGSGEWRGRRCGPSVRIGAELLGNGKVKTENGADPPTPRQQCKSLKGKGVAGGADRKSTRLNSSHPSISYAVFC